MFTEENVYSRKGSQKNTSRFWLHRRIWPDLRLAQFGVVFVESFLLYWYTAVSQIAQILRLHLYNTLKDAGLEERIL